MNRLAGTCFFTAILLWSLCSMAASGAARDTIYLRNGEVWEGTIFQESAAEYAFVPSAAGAPLRRIPRAAVRFALYGDDAKADRALGISAARRLCQDARPVSARILGAEDFGRAILDAARNAQTSVWVSAYAFSPYLEGPVGVFFAVLAAKVKDGVEVVLLGEYGQATPPSVKQATRNFLAEMARYGMRAYLLGERKALHKKLLIVDRRVVFLGSSNLTPAGTLYNQDVNVRIDCPVAARPIIADFEHMRRRAIPLEKWRD